MEEAPELVAVQASAALARGIGVIGHINCDQRKAEPAGKRLFFLKTTFVGGVVAAAGDFDKVFAAASAELEVRAPGGARIGRLNFKTEAAAAGAGGYDVFIFGAQALAVLIEDFVGKGRSVVGGRGGSKPAVHLVSNLLPLGRRTEVGAGLIKGLVKVDAGQRAGLVGIEESAAPFGGARQMLEIGEVLAAQAQAVTGLSADVFNSF